MLDILVDYDNGYLISGRIVPNYPKYNWLIKTDINGEILWEKLIGDGQNSIVLINMDKNHQGDLFLVGVTGAYGDYSDPFIIKLNPCGEKEWCMAIPSYDNMDYAYDVVALEDGGCTVSLRYTGQEPGVDRICMTNLDAYGNQVWYKCYNSADSNLFSPDHCNLIRTPDDGYLITGYCYYTDPEPPHYGWLHPYFIKTDSSGIFQWELAANHETAQNGGEAFSTVVSPDESEFYAAASHYYHGEIYGDAPSLVRFDMSGNLIGFFDLAEPGYYGKMFDLAFISDTTVAVSAIWGDESHEPMAVVIDSNGLILHEAALLNNDYMSYVRAASDHKVLFYTETLDENENFDVYLFKKNSLLMDDTLYLSPVRYDTLCSHYIPFDTILTNDCGLILDIKENQPDTLSSKPALFAWPNPCSDRLNLKFDIGMNPVKLHVSNIFGQIVFAQELNNFENQIVIQTKDFPTGILILSVQTADKQVYNIKIIKI